MKNSGPTLENFVQSETNPVPLFVEKCIAFVEEEGLDSEGIYRVPGNRAHVDLLFQKFDEGMSEVTYLIKAFVETRQFLSDQKVSIRELDIPVNAVATALKDFFSKRLPPLIPPILMDDLAEISAIQDKNCRLLEYRDLIKNLPSVNYEVLKFVFRHFVK